jgi:hypothetical protein
VLQQVLLGPGQDHGEDLQKVLGQILREQGEGVAVGMLEEALPDEGQPRLKLVQLARGQD